MHYCCVLYALLHSTLSRASHCSTEPNKPKFDEKNTASDHGQLVCRRGGFLQMRPAVHSLFVFGQRPSTAISQAIWHQLRTALHVPQRHLHGPQRHLLVSSLLSSTHKILQV